MSTGGENNTVRFIIVNRDGIMFDRWVTPQLIRNVCSQIAAATGCTVADVSVYDANSRLIELSELETAVSCTLRCRTPTAAVTRQLSYYVQGLADSLVLPTIPAAAINAVDAAAELEPLPPPLQWDRLQAVYRSSSGYLGPAYESIAQPLLSHGLWHSATRFRSVSRAHTQEYVGTVGALLAIYMLMRVYFRTHEPVDHARVHMFRIYQALSNAVEETADGASFYGIRTPVLSFERQVEKFFEGIDAPVRFQWSGTESHIAPVLVNVIHEEQYRIEQHLRSSTECFWYAAERHPLRSERTRQAWRQAQQEPQEQREPQQEPAARNTRRARRILTETEAQDVE